MDIADRLSSLSKDELLSLVGLQTRRNAAEIALPILASFGAGLIAGAAVVALTTPHTGAATRKILSKQAQKVADKASELYQDA